MRRFLFALAGAVLSAGYWWCVVTVAFGLVGGDPGPAAPPRSAAAQNIVSGVVFAVAVIGYALATLAWQRIEGRRGR